MQFLFDHLASVALAGAVALVLVAVSIGRAEISRDATRFHSHQRAQAGFTSVLEFDLMNAGIGTPVGIASVVEASPARFAFYSVVDPVGTTGLVEYRVTAIGTLDGATVYAVDRYVDGAHMGGGRQFSRFDVSTLTASGVATPAADAKQIRVEAEWVLPHTESGEGKARQALRRTAWSTTVLPLGLQS